MDRKSVNLWDKFYFVGDSPSGRKIWAVGSAVFNDDVLVTELSFDGDLTPDNLPADAGFYPQRFLTGRKGMRFYKPSKIAA